MIKSLVCSFPSTTMRPNPYRAILAI